MDRGDLDLLVKYNITSPILLKKDEGIVKSGKAVLYAERSKRVSTGGGSYGGISFPLGGRKTGIRMYAGSFRTPATYKTVTETKAVDNGDLIITNKRLVFLGSSKTIDIDWPKLAGINISGRLIDLNVGNRTYRLCPDNSVKWLRYIEKSFEKFAH